MMHADFRLSKSSPLKYLESFPNKYSSNVSNNFVVLDQGVKFIAILPLWTFFWKYNYNAYPTGSNASFQNCPVRCGHQTIATSVWALLFGTGLNIKFWLYAFHYALQTRNMLPHYGQLTSPLKLATSEKDKLKNFCTFGCHMWVCPPGVWKKCFTDDCWKGIHVGYILHKTDWCCFMIKDQIKLKLLLMLHLMRVSMIFLLIHFLKCVNSINVSTTVKILLLMIRQLITLVLIFFCIPLCWERGCYHSSSS